MSGFLIVLLFVVVVFVTRAAAGSSDKDRIRRYIEAQGGMVISQEWSPMGRGWFGEKDSWIYKVQYQDARGNLREATCKTSMWSGVYFTDDRVMSASAGTVGATGSADLSGINASEEIERLRAENDRLRRELDQARQMPKPLFQSEPGNR